MSSMKIKLKPCSVHKMCMSSMANVSAFGLNKNKGSESMSFRMHLVGAPVQAIHSLKLTFSHLKKDGWNTFSFPFGMAHFQGLC